MIHVLLSLLIFVGKMVLIEWAIEFVRFATYSIVYNAWPKEMLLTHENRYFSWFINGTESLMVVIFLCLGYRPLWIILITASCIFLIKQSGSYVLKKCSS